MTKTRLLIQNVYYHIFIRGNQKQNVFQGEKDFKFYIEQLQRYKRKYSFLLFGYCLMPNHIHLIGEPVHPKKLPKFMQCLHRSYTAYFNNKYNKVGHLWQGRFKTKIIAKDKYLIQCIAYVEQNPVRANLINSPEEYEFSSYSERNLGDNLHYKLLDKLSF